MLVVHLANIPGYPDVVMLNFELREVFIPPQLGFLNLFNEWLRVPARGEGEARFGNNLGWNVEVLIICTLAMSTFSVSAVVSFSAQLMSMMVLANV